MKDETPKEVCGYRLVLYIASLSSFCFTYKGGSVAESLACWTQAQKGPGSNRSRDAVGQQS